LRVLLRVRVRVERQPDRRPVQIATSSWNCSSGIAVASGLLTSGAVPSAGDPDDHQAGGDRPTFAGGRVSVAVSDGGDLARRDSAG
jgi:hypothetical protein